MNWCFLENQSVTVKECRYHLFFESEDGQRSVKFVCDPLDGRYMHMYRKTLINNKIPLWKRTRSYHGHNIPKSWQWVM